MKKVTTDNQLPLESLENALVKLKSPIVITDKQANIVYVNREFERTTGYGRREVLGMNPRILQTGLTRKGAYDQLWNDLTSGRCWRGEFINKKKDGTSYSEAAIIAPLELGDRTYFLGIKFDLSAIMNRKVELETIMAKSQMILDSLPIFIAYLDKDLVYQYVNEPYSRGFGMKWNEIVGRPAEDVLPEYLSQRHIALLKDTLEGKTMEFESHGPSPDSPVKNIYGVYVPDKDSCGETRGIVDFSFDVTRLKQAEEEKRLARKQFEIIAESVPGIIFQFRLTPDARWSFEYFQGDPEVLDRLGLNAELLRENSELAFDLVPEEKRTKLNTALYRSAEEMSPFQWIEQFMLPGGPIWLKITATPQRYPDQSICWTGLALEITDQKKIQMQVEQQNVDLKIKAETDYLTGLKNRRRFEQEVNKEIDRFRRYGTPFCYAILDLDKFKKINDRYGHDLGDLVLKDLAMRLGKSLRKLDVPGRVGGEEFALLLPETTLAEAAAVCERFQETLRTDPLCIAGNGLTIPYSCSIGLTAFRADDDRGTLFKRADELLYKAKANGRDRTITDG